MDYRIAISWMKTNFREKILNHTYNTPYSIDLVCAIACKETAIKWLLWIDKYTPETILERCVFDASGDFPGTSRNAFPKNKEAFLKKYGPELTSMLIAEANKTRAMPQSGYPRGYSPANYLYKGYGIFQYDLQNILADDAFFKEKYWSSFDHCMNRLILILNDKANYTSTLRALIKSYNGSGIKADIYAEQVLDFMELSRHV